jgi:hypothetical protein
MLSVWKHFLYYYIVIYEEHDLTHATVPKHIQFKVTLHKQSTISRYVN